MDTISGASHHLTHFDRRFCACNRLDRRFCVCNRLPLFFNVDISQFAFVDLFYCKNLHLIPKLSNINMTHISSNFLLRPHPSDANKLLLLDVDFISFDSIEQVPVRTFRIDDLHWYSERPSDFFALYKPDHQLRPCPLTDSRSFQLKAIVRVSVDQFHFFGRHRGDMPLPKDSHYKLSLQTGRIELVKMCMHSNVCDAFWCSPRRCIVVLTFSGWSTQLQQYDPCTNQWTPWIWTHHGIAGLEEPVATTMVPLCMGTYIVQFGAAAMTTKNYSDAILIFNTETKRVSRAIMRCVSPGLYKGALTTNSKDNLYIAVAFLRDIVRNFPLCIAGLVSTWCNLQTIHLMTAMGPQRGRQYLFLENVILSLVQ